MKTAPRGICCACGRDLALRWCPGNPGGWAMRRHGHPGICEGSGCGYIEMTLTYDEAKSLTRPYRPKKVRS